jgi:hypothetical protein
MDIINENINAYVGQIATNSDNLEIADVVAYEDSEYYVVIKEADTGKGALELLVNPYTGDVYPEYGPNMMWNLKYGMMSGTASDHGMMGRSNTMMGGNSSRRGSYRNNNEYNTENFNINYNEANDISLEEAYTIANDYIAKNMDANVSIEDSFDFYGYYTIHLEADGKMVGMLSVNGFSKEVWYHTWHGTVSDM